MTENHLLTTYILGPHRPEEFQQLKADYQVALRCKARALRAMPRHCGNTAVVSLGEALSQKLR